MYKIMIHIDTHTNDTWFYYQEEGKDYVANSLEEIRETVLPLIDVDGEDFTSAGEASAEVKKTLRLLGYSPETIRRVSIAMYEAEINMVIHAGGGVADVTVYEDKIEVILQDRGPGISNIELAMSEGYSTAPEAIRSLGFGAGMGIPNMKRYSDYFDIESTVGKGTKVTLVINT